MVSPRQVISALHASSRAAVRFVLGRRIGGLLGADADPVELHQAIRHAAAGHNYMAGPASRFTVGELHSFGEQSVFELLTSQQRVVVHYTLVVGLSRREVAELCGISLATVRSHLHDARQRLAPLGVDLNAPIQLMRFVQGQTVG